MAILRLFKNPTKLDFLCSMQILFIDEMGQMDDTMLAILDIILRKVKKSNIYMGGVLLIFTMDHLQIKPINGRPFLTSANIIPCFKMVNLQHSMRAWDDQNYQRIQQIARMHHSEFERNPALVDECVRLCSESFTFVDSWSDPKIHTATEFQQEMQHDSL